MVAGEKMKNVDRKKNLKGRKITRDEDPDPVIFGPPDPDPTCNNGFIKLFLS